MSYISPTIYNLIVGVLIAVANIISFLISSDHGFGLRCASGCHCVLRLVSVCHPMLTLAKHPTMTAPKNAIPTAWNKLRKRSCLWLRWCSTCILEDSKYTNSIYSKYHLLVLSCHSSVHMAHWQSSNNMSPSLFFHSLCITSSLPPPPSRPHRPFLGTLAFAVHSIHGGARGEEPLHDGSFAGGSRVVQRCPTSGAGSETSTAGGLHPVALHRPPPLQWEKFQYAEWSPWVSSFSTLYSELVQWQPLSLLVFVKITKTTNQKIWKRENRFLTPKKTYLNISQIFSSALSHPYSRPIITGSKCARVLLSQDVLWCLVVFHIDVLPSSCRECVVKRWSLRVGNSCYISAVMGRPKDASGCHCVLSLCHLMYCHLPNVSPWRLRRFPKSKSHLQQIPPISFILPQLCAHGALTVIKQHVTEFVLSLTLHHIIPPSTPFSSPPAVSGDPGRCCPQHPRRRPRRGAAPRRRCRRCSPPCAAVSNLRRRRARTRQRLEGSTPLLSTAHPHCSGRNCNLWSEVPEFYLFQNCIGSWLNGSHYLLLVFVKITKTTNWWHLPEKDIRKGEKPFSYA